MPSPKSDSHDSFLRLYVECEESLRGYVRSLLPTLEDAREVMQNTAAVLWRKFDQLDHPKNFRRWAFGVARFEVLSYRRDKARDRHIFGEELITQLAQESEKIGMDCDPEIKALKFCLAKLPPKQSALVQEAYDKDLKIKQIAEREGRTPMSVYKVLHRARIALADCIKETLEAEGAKA
ncbi:MAG: sigma-70 family RNA polymerase sigma factor [Opitutales bacterium]|nr:sigma-70 family RNA polymerase sigma factor [Opitutales bacterium]